MPQNVEGLLFVRAAIPDYPFDISVGEPSKVLIRPEAYEGPYTLVGEPVVQLATEPAAPDAVQLTWEINDLVPHDGGRYRTRTAVFVGAEASDLLKDKSFEILASRDGNDFKRIASVAGPTNNYVHRGIAEGRLHYYKVRAYDADGKLIAESQPTMGAAGANLVTRAGHESFRQGPISEADHDFRTFVVSPPEAFAIAKGARPYSAGNRTLEFDPGRGGVKQVSVLGNLIRISQGKSYLQGGWVRAPGNVWYGRYFSDENAAAAQDQSELHQKSSIGWSYSMMALTDTPEWTFAVQLLEVDADGSSFPREGKVGHARNEVARWQWTYPRDAQFLRLFVTAFGPGEVDDHWIVEVKNPIEGSAAVPRTD